MDNMPDAISFAACAERDKLLALSPFYSLSYHFGMLLGEEDFKTEQAYHRAKMRLHNAWLHREGVVWGLRVQVSPEDRARGEIRVQAGLAYDCAGRELHLERDACVNVVRWFEKHKGETDFETLDDGRQRRFKAHVVLRFKACLDRQVPALVEPCEGAARESRYSRIFETVEIFLRPKLAPVKDAPYRRLRLLFGLDEPRGGNAEDKQVVDELERIDALNPAERAGAYSIAFRRFAVEDEMELAPAQSADGNERLLFPCGDDDDEVVLANLEDITLVKLSEELAAAGEEWKLKEDVDVIVDNAVRPCHVATTAIQELLSSSLITRMVDGKGPRVDPESVKFEEPRKITFAVTEELNAESVKPVAFSVTSFSNAGWQKNDITNAAFDVTSKTITLDLQNDLSGDFVRLIARGTGETPLIDKDGVPLAGSLDGPASSRHNGNDFVWMHKRS